MARSMRLKKNKIMWVLIILIGALAFFAYIILYNGGVVLKKTTSTEVLSKLKVIEFKGGQFELTQKDVDELSSLFFAKPISKRGITLTGANIEIKNNELLFKAPITYKKINLLLTSEGKLNFSNGKVTYAADNFKIGKLTLPKKLVMSQILKLNNKNISIDGNLIKINPSVFPFKITSLKIEDNKILGIAEAQSLEKSFDEIAKMSAEEINKQLDTVKIQIQIATVLMNASEKAKVKEIQNIIEQAKDKSIGEKKQIISGAINKLNEIINKTTDNDKKKELEKIKAEAEKAQMVAEEKEKISQEQNETTRIALTKAQSDLGGAYSQVDTSKEKQVISIMQSAMGKMAANSSYNSSSDQASVKSIYSTLDSSSKNKVKYALATNVNGSNIQLLRQIFGL